MKQVWFGNGIHHHYSMDKFVPGFTREWFTEQVAKVPAPHEGYGADIDTLMRVVFDPAFQAKRVNQAEGGVPRQMQW